jgi:hypothetical protein
MMSDSTEPRWDLLPHQPEQFFELPEPFDRKDLKRKYNALIRQFKPEKHPEEFQRIRAAFEQLDNQLRYSGQSSGRNSSCSTNLDWAAPQSQPTEQEPSTPTADERIDAKPRPIKPKEKTPLERLQERLQAATPADVFQQLESEPSKLPFDYFVLAILSDITQADSSQPFLKWLLRGLMKHPNDAGLTRLLSAFLQSDIPLGQLPAIVQAVAKAIPNDRFYSMTEPLWDRLLQARPFEQVAKLLAECESQLKDHRLDGKLTFYVHILRRALWLADDAWINAAFTMLEEHGSEVAGSLEYDFEFLNFLRTYREERKTFLNGTAGREMIDQAMQDYCLKSDYEADRAVLECQLALATESGWLRQAFPISTDNFPAWWTLWNWITADVFDRVGDAESDFNPELLFQQLRQVLRRCEQVTDKSWLGWAWSLLGIVYLFAFAVIVTTLIMLCLLVVIAGTVFVGASANLLNTSPSLSNTKTSAFFVIASGTAFLVLLIATGTLLLKVLRKRRPEEIRRWLARQLGRRSYQRQWRPLMEQHLSLTHQPFRLLIDQLAVEHDDISQVYTSWIHAHVSCDYGLACVAMAQRFLR